MRTLIQGAIARNRATLLMFGFVVVAGAASWFAIPKEAEPDIAIPMIYVRASHDGISPEDAERLLVKPLESELRSVEGLDEISSTAAEGMASLLLEFDAGFDVRRALIDVREKVDVAKSELPDDTDEPVVEEVNVALFPVLTLSLSGSLPERELLRVARDLEESVEALPGVLEVDIGGDREEQIEVVIDPTTMAMHGIALPDVLAFVQRNNQLIAAGSTDASGGRLSLKVPGVLDGLDDLLSLPIKVVGPTVVTVADVATVSRGFKDPEGFARVGGRSALVLEVKKRLGTNIIETIEDVHELVSVEQASWPAGIQVDVIQDSSVQIRTMLADLQNNVTSAVLLVMIIVLGALGARSAGLVGLAIPASFLAGVLVIDALGMTLNIVVLFSLILVVGMLVDGAIVVVELAERKLDEGLAPAAAYAAAASRMAWPITASTATTIAVFLPLLFWPGLVGEFMRYLPVTVVICLGASLAAALIFVPTLGATLSRRRSATAGGEARAKRASRLGLAYERTLRAALRRPGLVVAATLVVLVATYGGYAVFGAGVEFFPEVEPESVQVHVHARGDLTITEKDGLVRAVEERLAGTKGLESVYARSLARAGEGLGEDVVGVLQLQLVDWDERRPARAILAEIRERVDDLPGVVLELRKEESGPSGGKPIQLEVTGGRSADRHAAVKQVREIMDELGGFAGTEDDRPLPGVEWHLVPDRERAARHGADIGLLGAAVQLVTTGLKATDYRPDDIVDEIDVRVRFPDHARNLSQLEGLRIQTDRGLVPVGNFVSLAPAPRTGTLSRVNGRPAVTIQSDVTDGLLVDDQLGRLRGAIAATSLPSGVEIAFRGETEDMEETMRFLGIAFLVAVFLMTTILTLQFNNLYQTALVLSAVVLSTTGVLLGLLVTGQPFGVVMVGLGLIALAGIVVNNNIVLIDTYNEQRREGLEPVEAAVETGRLRLRPVLLTAVTTVVGLMPMVFGLNVDFFARHVALGAPATQWWTQLSTAIAGGLVFATVLTLAVTPCLLVVGDRRLQRA